MSAGTLKGRDFLRVADFSTEEITRTLDLATRVKADRELLSGRLAGRSAALLFEKPSLRTKSSFAVGAARLGMTTLFFSAPEVGIGERESVADVARMFSRYFDLIVHRTFGQDRIHELAQVATVPVLNALTDLEHPCQAMADILTLRERFGRLEGLHLAWVGDGNNVCHSLMAAAARCGMSLAVSCPSGHGPQDAVLAEVRALGGPITLVDDPAKAVAGAHAVYTDTWVSMGREAEHAARVAIFTPYRVDAALMSRARADAVFLHCLPAHRGEEVTSEVLDSPASVVLDQAENRLHVQLALMALVLGAA